MSRSRSTIFQSYNWRHIGNMKVDWLVYWCFTSQPTIYQLYMCKRPEGEEITPTVGLPCHIHFVVFFQAPLPGQHDWTPLHSGIQQITVIFSIIYQIIDSREKGRDLTQSYDKSPYTHRKIQKATWQHRNATKYFDCTTIADRLRTVSLGNDSYPTGVVKPVNGIPTPPPPSTPPLVLSRART